MAVYYRMYDTTHPYPENMLLHPRTSTEKGANVASETALSSKLACDCHQRLLAWAGLPLDGSAPDISCGPQNLTGGYLTYINAVTCDAGSMRESKYTQGGHVCIDDPLYKLTAYYFNPGKAPGVIIAVDSGDGLPPKLSCFLYIRGINDTWRWGSEPLLTRGSLE